MVTDMARPPRPRLKSRGPPSRGIFLHQMLSTLTKVGNYVTSTTEDYPCGRLLKNFTGNMHHALCNLYKRAVHFVSGDCQASTVSRAMKLLSDLQKELLERLYFGCKFPSSQAFGNVHGLNPPICFRDCRMDITDESTPDAYEDHAVIIDMDVVNLQSDGNHYTHASKQSATHYFCSTGDVDDTCDMHSSAQSPSCYGTCYLNSPVLCRPDVIVVDTSEPPHGNSTAKSATCEEKHAENHVENHVGTAMSDCRTPSTLPSDSDILEHKRGKESNFDSLPEDIQIEILKRLPYEELFGLKLVSKGLKSLTGSEVFRHSTPNSSALSPLYFHIRNGEYQLSGLDVVSKKWRPLPTLRCLPSPGQNQFKEYLFSSSGGLLCVNISKSVECERIIVYNPMMQTQMVLPPLNFRRNPVLLHMLVNPNTNSYIIIAAGSSGWTEGHLSRKTEVFNSLTSKWEVTGDIPGCEFSLNEYQTGVCVDGVLYCVAFLEDASAKGVLAYDVKQGKWLSDWRISLPCPEYSNSFSTAQVVECDNQVYLFSERETTGHTVEHRIDKLDSTDRASGVGKWTNVVRENKTGGRGLLVYPEYACVGFGVGKLCIFNTLEHTGKVYDIRHGGPPENLPPPQSKGVEVFQCLNPLSFTFEPNFKSLVEVHNVMTPPLIVIGCQ